MDFTDDQIRTGEWVRQISAQSYRGWKAFYHTREWRRCREEALRRDHGQCMRCREQGKYTPAVTVHHVQHLREVPELALTLSNLQSLCEACHNAVHPEKAFEHDGFHNEERW